MAIYKYYIHFKFIIKHYFIVVDQKIYFAIRNTVNIVLDVLDPAQIDTTIIILNYQNALNLQKLIVRPAVLSSLLHTWIHSLYGDWTNIHCDPFGVP